MHVPGLVSSSDPWQGVVVLESETRTLHNSVFWLDHVANPSRALNVASLAGFRRSPGGIQSAARAIRNLRKATLAVGIGNSAQTRRLLLLSLAGLVRVPIAVLELNLKLDELSRLERWAGRMLFSRASLITVLSPSDREAIVRQFDLKDSQAVVVDQWAQPDGFSESETARVRAMGEDWGWEYALMAGRSSRNVDELFRALTLAPEVKVIVLGCSPESVPANLRPRVRAVAGVGFEEYMWLLRRARFCVIPLRNVAYTCGLRVWFQSAAVGTAVIITATEPVAYYISRGALARVYPPGDASRLAAHMTELWRNDTSRRELASSARLALGSHFRVDEYDAKIGQMLDRLLARSQ